MKPSETVKNDQILYAIWDKKRKEWIGGLSIPNLFEKEEYAKQWINISPPESWIIDFWKRNQKNFVVKAFAKVVIGE